MSGVNARVRGCRAWRSVAAAACLGVVAALLAVIPASAGTSVGGPDIRPVPGAGKLTHTATWSFADQGARGRTVSTVTTSATPVAVRVGGTVHAISVRRSVATLAAGSGEPSCGAGNTPPTFDETRPVTPGSFSLIRYEPGSNIRFDGPSVPGGVTPQATGTQRTQWTCRNAPFSYVNTDTFDVRVRTAGLEPGCYAVEPGQRIGGGFLAYYYTDPSTAGTVASFAVGVGIAACTAAAVGPSTGSVVAGTVTVAPPGGTATPLGSAQALPAGTVVDATAGAVRLKSGGGKDAVFSRGAFRVGKAGSVTELVLSGGDFSVCKQRRPSGVSATKPRVVRRLWGDGKGRFRTRGRYAAATVRGTAWDVTDACEGTTIRVRRGSVEVRDLRTGKTRVVRAGQSVTVRA